jgi:hypothetical protein
VDFAIGGVTPLVAEPIGILADYRYLSPEGHLCGVFVFERSGQLAGLEVWSIDGLCTPSTLPATDKLRELGSA